MVQLGRLIFGLHGEVHAESAEYVDIDLGKDHAGMDFTMFEFGELFQGDLCVVIGKSANGKRDQDFVHVQTWVLMTELCRF